MNEKKQKIIVQAALLFHQYGYNNVGINMILSAIGIPKGSFYHFFKSKEDLIIHVIQYHFHGSVSLFNDVMGDNRSVDGLKQFLSLYFKQLEANGYRDGCPVGNLMVEMSSISEAARQELMKWIGFLENEIAEILVLDKIVEDDEAASLASYIMSAFEGAVMQSKVRQDGKPLNEFMRYVFEYELIKKR